MAGGYLWLKFLHIAAVFAFLLSHGAAGGAALLLRSQREFAVRRLLLELSWKAQSISQGALFVVLLSGIALGFYGDWWGHGWIWTALAVFLLVLAVMTYYSMARFDSARKAAGLPYRAGVRIMAAVSPNPDSLAGQIPGLRARELAIAGSVGLAVILWLMLVKPF
jgi:hypothetical protein